MEEPGAEVAEPAPPPLPIPPPAPVHAPRRRRRRSKKCSILPVVANGFAFFLFLGSCYFAFLGAPPPPIDESTPPEPIFIAMTRAGLKSTQTETPHEFLGIPYFFPSHTADSLWSWHNFLLFLVTVWSNFADFSIFLLFLSLYLIGFSLLSVLMLYDF